MRIREILICLGFGPLSILYPQEVSKPANAVTPDASGTKSIQLKYLNPEQLRKMALRENS